MKTLHHLLLAALLAGCAPKATMSVLPADYNLQGNQGLRLNGIAMDNSYGYSAENPINIGSENPNEGPVRQRLFLNSLAGPDGQPLQYMRVGSCCSFSTENGFNGIGLLDKYQIIWEGQSRPVTLYLNMYEPGEVKAPVGFSVRI